MAKRETIRALCTGWLCGAVALVATYAVPSMPFATQVIVIVIAGAAPTLFMLNRD